MIKAVIFDLDGTLLDTLQDLADSVNLALKTHQLPPRSLEEIRAFVGNGVNTLIKRSLPQDLAEDEKIHQKVLDSFMEIYQANKDKTTKLYPGIEDMLETLALSGYDMAILSNKPHYHLVPICQKYFSYPFAFVYGQREGIPKKPDKNSLLSIIDEMGLKKEEVIYVGDSEVDIKTAKNADVKVIAVSWGFRDYEFLEKLIPDALVTHPDELVAYLLEL